MFTRAVNAINSLNKTELLDLSSIIDNRLKYLKTKKEKSYYVLITNIASSLDKDYFERTLPGKVVAMGRREWVAMVFDHKHDYEYSMRNYDGWRVDGHRLHIIRLNKHVSENIIKKSRSILDMSLDELFDIGYCPEIIESDTYPGDSLPYPKVSQKQLDIELYAHFYNWRKPHDPNY